MPGPSAAPSHQVSSRTLTVTILQGPPGGGKSTRARALADLTGAVICSADDHMLEGGKYVFRAWKLPLAHHACRMMAQAALAKGLSVVIDNTNIRAWEARPYVEMALAAGAMIVFERIDGGFTSTHGVPADKVAQMRASMEVLSVATCLTANPPEKS